MDSSFIKVGFLFLTLTPTLLSAQTDQEKADEAAKENTSLSVLDEVIVSGEIQARNIQDTTTSVSVFNTKKLNESADANIYDTLNRTANASGIFGNKGFGIRGIPGVGAGGSGGSVGRTIEISVDGASIPTTQATFFGPYSTWDLEQIEILRGPQSTQQGRNALAGSINIRTAEPDFVKETKLRLRAGELGESNVAITHNQPINDNWAARITLEKGHFDGTVTNPTRQEDDYDERDLSLIRGKLLYQPSDDLSVVFGHSYTDNRGGEDQILLDQFPQNRVNLSDNEVEEGSKHNITGLKIDYNINDRWSLRSETTHYKHDYTRLEDFDQTPLPGAVLDRELDDKSISQEFKFIYDNDEKLRGAVGVFATSIDANFNGKIVSDASLIDPRIPAGAAVFRREFLRTIKTDNIALYGELDYDLSNKWTLITGARYDYEKVKLENNTEFFLDPLIAPLPDAEAVKSTTSYNAFLPKLGIKYNINKDINTSFTIQRGYRAGGSDRNSLTLEVTDFDPEYTTNYELAVRSRLWNDHVQLNGNLFFTDWKDQQVRVFGPSGNQNDQFTANAGESKVYGAELELQVGVSDKLAVYSSVGYAKTEFKDFKNGADDFSGNSFSFAPEITASIGGKYKFTNKWSLQLDGNFKDSFYSDADNNSENKVNSRFLLDAKLGYEAKKWSAHLYARNLLDKQYLTQTFDTGARAGDPRVVGLEFNAKF